jgi:hypothetical protein
MLLAVVLTTFAMPASAFAGPTTEIEEATYSPGMVLAIGVPNEEGICEFPQTVIDLEFSPAEVEDILGSGQGVTKALPLSVDPTTCQLIVVEGVVVSSAIGGLAEGADGFTSDAWSESAEEIPTVSPVETLQAPTTAAASDNPLLGTLESLPNLDATASHDGIADDPTVPGISTPDLGIIFDLLDIALGPIFNLPVVDVPERCISLRGFWDTHSVFSNGDTLTSKTDNMRYCFTGNFVRVSSHSGSCFASSVQRFSVQNCFLVNAVLSSSSEVQRTAQGEYIQMTGAPPPGRYHHYIQNQIFGRADGGAHCRFVMTGQIPPYNPPQCTIGI